MWSRLTRGGDGLPREKVDAIVRLIDQYLAEEANSPKPPVRQTNHSPPGSPARQTRSLVNDVFEILKDTDKR